MKSIILLPFLIYSALSLAQNWSLTLSSKVELRNWRLSSTAEKTEKSLTGATIILYKDKIKLNQVNSDSQGNFTIDVPAKGEYILTIEYAGCNTKRFYVSTNGVPEEVGKDNYKPTVSITGFLMSKPIKGVDYLGLNEPLVKVEYKKGGQNFDKDDAITNKGMEIVSKIYDAENSVIEKFCAANKEGDLAMKKKNCDLAKDCYTKALALIPDEQYPKEQWQKADQCIKDKKLKEEVNAQIKAEQDLAAKAEKDKIASEKKKKENDAMFNKNNTAKTSSTSTLNINSKENASENKTQSGSSTGTSKYSIPKKLAVDRYKDFIKKGDSYFKVQHYKEAKAAYEEALKEKPKDETATGKITECEKYLN